MKKLALFISLLMICTVAISVVAKRQAATSPKSEPREVREQRREARQAQTEKMIDSLVLSHTFQFTPQTMQQQIAGPMNMLSNPNFEIGIWDGSADIFIPYIKGIVPPYRHVILNCTILKLENYISEQTESGWQVSFSSNLYSASTYTFVFDINSRYGSTNLTIKNPWYDSVEYTGTISKFY